MSGAVTTSAQLSQLVIVQRANGRRTAQHGRKQHPVLQAQQQLIR